MEKQKAISLNNISMVFNLATEKTDTLKEYILKAIKHQLMFQEFYALQDVNLNIEKGDSVGLIGTNGSGKSTLLKIIAGVLQPTTGTVIIHGTIAPLIELGAGFDMDLTARENIYLNGAVLGYDRKYMNEHFDSIIDFAELRDFVDVPVKNFSSGMVARLGFAIATEVKADILIVDEVLSVGDFKFQEKCKERISNLLSKGTTLLFVSHSTEQVMQLCNKAVWLSNGKIQQIGDSSEVCKQYMRTS